MDLEEETVFLILLSCYGLNLASNSPGRANDNDWDLSNNAYTQKCYMELLHNVMR